MLPKINDTAYVPLTVPSTGQVFHFRPYLVLEEKVLLLAMESEDEVAILDAIKNTLAACCQETLGVERLAMFDFEYLFAQVRANSVGQTTVIRMRCDQQVTGEDAVDVTCGHVSDVEVDISSITIDVDPSATVLALTPNHTLTVRWPSYADTARLAAKQKADKKANKGKGDNLKTESVEDMFDLISNCLVSIQTEDSIYKFDEETKGDIHNWMNALTADQLKMMLEFINNTPRLSHPIEYKCGSCGNTQTTVLEGLTDFF